MEEGREGGRERRLCGGQRVIKGGWRRRQGGFKGEREQMREKKMLNG